MRAAPAATEAALPSTTGESALGPCKVFHPPSGAATCLALTVPTGKEEKCLQACSSPQCPPAAGGARAKPLPLALHPVCTQILLLVLLFPKRRTKTAHTSDSGQPINQLLVSWESALLNSPLTDTGHCSLRCQLSAQTSPRPDPCSWQKVRSVPWLCSRPCAWPVAPSALLRLLPGARGLPRPGLSAAEHQPRCRPSPASLEPGPACFGTEELHLRGLKAPCSGHALSRKARRRRRRETADEQNDRLQSANTQHHP